MTRQERIDALVKQAPPLTPEQSAAVVAMVSDR